MKKLLSILGLTTFLVAGCVKREKIVDYDAFCNENRFARVETQKGHEFSVDDIDGDGLVDYIGPANRSESDMIISPAYVTEEASKSLGLLINGRTIRKMSNGLQSSASDLLRFCNACSFQMKYGAGGAL
jgi:hypothetical protein